MFLIFLISLVSAAFLDRWLLTKANNKIWGSKIVQLLAKTLPFAFVLFAPLWALGTWQDIPWIRLFGASGTSLSLVLNLVMLLSLPFSFLVSWIGAQMEKSKTTQKKAIDPSRRLFLKTAAASVPALAIAGAGTGLISSFSQTRFPQITMKYPNLPEILEGFKILHLSDLHLGYYFGLDHLERTLLDAEKYQPDMVVVTGDIADDLTIMTDAMKMIGQFKTPFPKYASIGNHEYFRGIKKSIRMIEAGPVPLLLNKHDLFKIGDTKILVGGADDPVSLRSDIHGFLDNSLTKTFSNSPEADFKLLMSHRPRALDLASKFGVDLTLSGHTHGGQIGFAGRSFWDIFNENGYLWGSYQKENARLYTSAGMGHWFPFRLNCPLEAPVITLVKSV
jgi:uncharacterized protein